MLVTALKAYHRHMPIERGKWRVTKELAAILPSLQEVWLRMPGGKICVDLRQSSAHALLRSHINEEQEQEIMADFAKPDSVVYDIGAHWGVHTVWMASLAKKVFAFEPCGTVLPSLRRTCARLKNVDLIEAVLSDRAGSSTLFVPEDGSQASIGDWTGSGKQLACESRTLDQLNLTPPAFIKCDVEGAEFLVFGGARKTLSAHKPAVLFEVNPQAMSAFGQPWDAAINVLRECGYASFKKVGAQGLSALPSNEFCNVLATV